MTIFAEELLKKHYCREDETIEQAFIRACNCFGTNQEHSNRLQDYLKKEWFMFSSPILSNAINGVFDDNRFIYMEQPKGLPISCFLGYVDDSIAVYSDINRDGKVTAVDMVCIVQIILNS